jgi:hypothetical protein
MIARREAIALLGGAAAWPLTARAQQGERVRRIGVLDTQTSDNPVGRARNGALLQGLRQLGWTEGHNFQVTTRWAAGDDERLRKYAAELVELTPDVIVATGSPAVAPLLQATRTVPIVFVNVADPVGAGFVDSLAHPGRNATGFTMFEYSTSAKLLELLKDTTPHLRRAAVIRDAALTSGTGQFAAIQALAPSLGVEHIHGELLKLGFEVAQLTVAKYMAKGVNPSSQGWGTFLRNLRRRAFITLLGGAAAWPLAARAQQPGERMRRIGVLMNVVADEDQQANVAAFRQVSKASTTIHRLTCECTESGPQAARKWECLGTAMCQK